MPRVLGLRHPGRRWLTELAHFRGEGGLVAHGRGHAPQQRRDLHAGQGITVDIIDKEQDVLSFNIAEILRHGQAGQPHAQTHAGRLVHLPEDHDRLIDNAGLFHLAPEVVALAGALADAGKDGKAAVHGGDIADKLLDDNRLAHAGAAVSPDFTAPGERHDKVDDFKAGLQYLGAGLLLIEGGG